MRDVFANYDAWLEQPYQDAADADARAEYIAEHSTYTSCCCGVELEPEDARNARPDADGMVGLLCPKCHEWSEFNTHEPTPYDAEVDYDERD